MSEKEKFEAGVYTPDDILDWYDTHTSPNRINALKKQPKENFDEVEEYEENGIIYEIGTTDGISVIIGQKKKPEIFGVGLTEAQIGGLQVKQQLNTAGDIAKKTPGFLGETLNPINLAKGVNKGVKNAFGLVDNLTGGEVTKLDNYLVENFPNTLGKKIEYEKPQTAGSMTGEIIGQYVITDLLLRRAFPFFNKNMVTGLAADATTVGLFSSADEGNLASVLGMFLPESEDPGAIAKAITSLQPDADDSEIQGRLKNVVIDTGALGAILSFFKVAKGLITNPKVADDLQEAQSAGAAATPKEAPTAVEVVDSSGQTIKQVDQTDEVVKSEKPFYSNVENTISNFTFKKQPGNQILATLNNTSGIKQSEIQDLGLDTFLKDNPSVTKEQLDDFIANKSLTTRVSSEVLEEGARIDINYADGKDFVPVPLARAKSFEEAKNLVDNVEPLYNELVRYIESFPGKGADDITDQIKTDFLGARYKMFPIEISGKKAKSTKFESYTTPGGGNYKEMLITAPGTPQVFTDHHYRGEVSAGENLIAHARFNDRTIDNKKILFIEEIQSDLHQAGRKQGYVPKDANSAEIIKQVDLLRIEKAKITKEIEDIKAKGFQSETNGLTLGESTKVIIIDGSNGKIVKTYELTGNATERSNIIGKAAVEADDMNKAAGMDDEIFFLNRDSDRVSRQILEAKGAGKIPDAPFKKNWYELTMKRIIKYAIDNGYDGISFTTGMMQVRRYPGMQNPEGLKGFYDNTLTDSINKFGKKYGAKLERTNINDGTELYRYTNDDVQEALDFTYDTVNQRGEIFASYKVIESGIPGERYQLVQIKNGKENVIYSQDDLDLVKEVLTEELDGFNVPQIKQDIKGSEVPILFFTPNMQKDILTEGVPIAQVEEKENKQQTTALV